MPSFGAITRRYHGIAEVWAKTSGQPISPAVQAEIEDHKLHEKIRVDHVLHREYVKRFQAGEPGLDALLLAINEPLMQKVANRYRTVAPDDWEDRLQNARLALLEGCARFDTTREVAPITYVWNYLRGYVRRDVINSESLVRFPVNRYKTDNPKGTAKLRAYVFPFSEIGFHHWGLSTEEAFENSFEDLLPDDHEPAEETLSDGEFDFGLQRVAKWIIEKVKEERSQRILHDRFLLEEPRTLIEIGEDYGISRERIRQLEAMALDECRAIVTRHMVPVEDYKTFEEWAIAAIYAFDQMKEPVTPKFKVEINEAFTLLDLQSADVQYKAKGPNFRAYTHAVSRATILDTVWGWIERKHKVKLQWDKIQSLPWKLIDPISAMALRSALIARASDIIMTYRAMPPPKPSKVAPPKLRVVPKPKRTPDTLFYTTEEIAQALNLSTWVIEQVAEDLGLTPTTRDGKVMWTREQLLKIQAF